MAINKTINKRTNSHGAMRNCIEYVLRPDKTSELLTYVTGPYRHDEINYDLVYRTFLEEKKMWDKDTGRMYAHNIISWHKDEQITPDQALEFGKEFAEKWFSGFQTLVAVHKDKDHIAHSYGATIEGELGHVGDNPDSAEGSAHINPADFYTDPRMAKDFVDKTGVDALAIAVGTAHGAYKLPPKLDFERINTIAHTVDVPLVLHGGSGLTDNDFKRAIQEGISKINIFTDINVAAVEAEFRKFESMNKGIIDLIPAAVEAVKQETMKKMILFSSNGKGVLDQPSQDELVKAVVQGVLKEIVGK